MTIIRDVLIKHPHHVTWSDWNSLGFGFYTSMLPTATLIWSIVWAQTPNHELSNLIMTLLRVILTGLQNVQYQS